MKQIINDIKHIFYIALFFVIMFFVFYFTNFKVDFDFGKNKFINENETESLLPMPKKHQGNDDDGVDMETILTVKATKPPMQGRVGRVIEHKIKQGDTIFGLTTRDYQGCTLGETQKEMIAGNVIYITCPY